MYIDICGLFGLSQTSFYHPVHGPLWPTIHAIDIALADHVAFKTDVSSCNKAAADFSLFSRGMLNHCVCAVDGISLLFFFCYNSYLLKNLKSYVYLKSVIGCTISQMQFNLVPLCTVSTIGLVIRTRCPTPREMSAFAAPDLASFINRKGYYGIVVMAACTANLEFFFCQAHWKHK